MVTNSNILGEDGDNRSMVMEVFAVRLAVVKGGPREAVRGSRIMVSDFCELWEKGNKTYLSLD